MIDELDPCTRCGDAAPEPRDVARWRDLGVSGETASALAECARCLAIDGTIDRAHTERALASFGVVAVPLEPWLRARAVAARPELAGASMLVADPDAELVAPREVHRDRLERLLSLHAPDVVVEGARRALADAETTETRLEWERVHAWPAPGRFRGTFVHGVIACALAERVFPVHLPDVSEPVLRAIARAAQELALDDAAIALRAELAEEARAASSSRARALDLAVRFLDELGHTGLRDNQDTLLDHAHGVDPAVYGFWLEVAVPRACRAASMLGPADG